MTQQKKWKIITLLKVLLVLVLSLTAFLAYLELGFSFVSMWVEEVGLPWDYWGWQTVEVSGICTFKVPGKWVVTQTDQEIYFTDQPMGRDEFSIYGAGTFCKWPDKMVDPVSLMDGMTRGDRLSLSGQGGSFYISLHEYFSYNYKTQLYSIDCHYESPIPGVYAAHWDEVRMIFWDENIDLGILERIMFSFSGTD